MRNVLPLDAPKPEVRENSSHNTYPEEFFQNTIPVEECGPPVETNCITLRRVPQVRTTSMGSRGLTVMEHIFLVVGHLIAVIRRNAMLQGVEYTLGRALGGIVYRGPRTVKEPARSVGVLSCEHPSYIGAEKAVYDYAKNTGSQLELIRREWNALCLITKP